MPTDEQLWRLAQLSDQQSALTSALRAMAEGRWYGEADSVEGWVIALNPTYAASISARAPLYEWPPVNEIPTPDVVWVGSPNFTPGHRGYEVCAIVLHTMAGTLEGCDSWFSQEASQVSSHYGIGLYGEQHQYVKLADSSWANGILQPGNYWPGPYGNPNYQTITIETEDNGDGDTPVSDAMYQATLEVANLALQTYPTIRWLLSHRVISPASRPDCCGDRWWDSGRFQALADELGLEAIA